MTSTLGVIGHHKQHQHRVVTDINIINLIMIIFIINNHKHQLYKYYYLLTMIKHARAGISKPFYAQGSNIAVHGQLPYIITRIQQLIIIKQSQSSNFSPVLKI